MECCGVDKVDDWEKNRPASCCHPSREGAVAPTVQHCQAAKENEDILYTTGCFSMIDMKVQSASKVLIGVGIGIAFVEVSGIFCKKKFSFINLCIAGHWHCVSLLDGFSNQKSKLIITSSKFNQIYSTVVKLIGIICRYHKYKLKRSALPIYAQNKIIN